MADLLGSSVGLGVGLSGQPNMYSNIYLANQQRADAEKAKKQAALDKYHADLDVKGTHRLLQKDAEMDAAHLLQEVQDLKDNNPNDFINLANKKVNEFKIRQAQRLEQSARYNDIEKKIGDRRASELATPEEVTLATEMATGSHDSLSKLPKDGFNIANYDPNSRNIIYNPLPQVDTNKLEKELVADPNLKTVMSMVKGKTIPLPNGGSVYYTSESIPKTRQEAQAAAKYLGVDNELPSIEGLKDQLTDNPSYLRRKVYELTTSGRLPQDYTKKPLDEQKQLVATEVAKDLFGKAGANVKQQIVSPPVPREGDQSNIYNLDDIQPDQSINLGVRRIDTVTGLPAKEIVNGKETNKQLVDQRPFAVRDAIEHKPNDQREIGVVKNDKVVDLATNKRMDTPGDIRMKPSKTFVAPVYKEGTKNFKGQDLSGTLIPEDKINKAIDNGVAQYSVLTSGSYKDGKRTVTVAVPTEQLRNSFKTKKDGSGKIISGLPIDEMQKRANAYNAEINKPKSDGYTETQQKAIAVFNEKIGRAPSASELQKILKKY